MTKVTLALWQRAPVISSPEDFLQSLDKILTQTRADVLITPELCWPGYGDASASCAAAVNQRSPFIAKVRALAVRHGIAVVLGYAETDGGHIYNSAICIGADGAIVANYRKQTIANDYERECFTRGNPAPVFEIKGVPVALLICLDAEFPELVRHASLEGALLLIVPTALSPKWQVIPDVVIPTRACENGIFVAYCNYAGGGNAAPFCGRSLVVGPDGRAMANAQTGECLLEVTINSGDVVKARGQLDYLRHLGDLLHS